MAHDGSVIIDIDGDDSKFRSKLSSLGKTALKVSSAALTATAASVSALAGLAVKSYASYEQLVGGVETLFKDSADTIQEYAARAYQTAGMNANDYMSTVTSFSASLIQSLGGDTEAAAEKADQAITDMADNANKMGSDMSMIIATYQSLARGNYAMLDNLKLGYGGTKAELERLLADAEKLSGQKYDISSFADIVDAIHVVQEEMGITGTTAKEAATTIEGSANSMKAAWQNVLTGISDENQDLGALLDEAIASTMTFGDNVIPRIQQTLKGIGEAFEILVPTVMETLPGVAAEIVPGIVDAVGSLVTSVGSSVAQYVPELLQSGVELIGRLADGIATGLPQLLSQALPMLAELSGGLREGAGQFVDAGLELIMAIGEGLIAGIPTFIETIPTIITNLAGIINDNAPKLLECGVELLFQLALGLIQAIPTIIENIPQIIQAIVAVFMAYNWIDMGKSLMTAVKDGIGALKGEIQTKVGEIASSIKEEIAALPSALKTEGQKMISNLAGGIASKISNVTAQITKIATGIRTRLAALPSQMLTIGGNIISGLWSGISNKVDWVLSMIGGLKDRIVAKVKSSFGIASPSKVMRDEVGKWIPLGIAQGIDAEAESIQRSLDKAVSPQKLTADVGVNVDQLNRRMSDEVKEQVQVTSSRLAGTVRADDKPVTQPGGGSPTYITYSPTFQSPKALNRAEIHRQSKLDARRLKKFA